MSFLRLAREKRDWSQAEVARKLNLTVSSLNHVETGAFDKLPGHTFARGYIRAYAKLMDLDQAALVDAFDRYTGTHAKGSDVHSLGRIEEPVRLSHNILRGVSLLLLVAVVGGGFFWWQDQGSLRGRTWPRLPWSMSRSKAPTAPHRFTRSMSLKTRPFPLASKLKVRRWRWSRALPSSLLPLNKHR